MNPHSLPPTRAQKIGCTVFTLTMVFCSMEMVPGWGIFRPNWSPGVFYGIMGLAGAMAGGLLPKHRIIGIPSGALAGPGALFAQACVLERVAVISNWFLLLFGGLGMLPGIGLYYGLRFLFFSSSSIQDENQVIGGYLDKGVTESSDSYRIDNNPTACPSCGGENFKKKKSEAFLAVLCDRICLDCGTRYAPPTPRWAGFIYFLGGLMCFACSFGCLWWNQIEGGRGKLRLGYEALWATILAVLGLICFGMGFRCFFCKAKSKVINPGQKVGTGVSPDV